MMEIAPGERGWKSKNPGESGVLRGYGRGRIRTCEGISHQIYSLTPLATWVHARVWVARLIPRGVGVYADPDGFQG